MRDLVLSEELQNIPWLSPVSHLPHTHLSCTIWGDRSEKHLKKVKTANKQESNPWFLFSDPCSAPDSTTLGSTFLLKYILLWWWQDLRFSNYSIWRTKDNEEEGTSSPLSTTDKMSIPASRYNHTPQSPPPIALQSLICQDECKATLKKHFLTNSLIHINNVNA